MKASLLLLAWFGFVLSPAGFVHASPPPADGPGSCSLDFQPDQFDTHAAAKRLTNPDTGEPRTVRLFYFLPNDNPYQASVVQRIKDEIRNIQTWYGEQMQAHEFGYNTFRIETDDQGEPLVHRVDGQHPDRHYVQGTFGGMYEEMKDVYDLSASINILVIDISTNRLSRVSAGSAAQWSKHSGVAIVADGFYWQTMAHELGHAFGLDHDFRDDSYIMSYGQTERNSLSACSAGFLAVHPYFNPDVSITRTQGPTIELLSPPAYPAGSESVPVRLRVSDSDGLHQVRMILWTRQTHSIDAGGVELKACRGLSGEEEAIVEFDYDGVVPSGQAWGVSDLSDPPQHVVDIHAVDKDGNRGGSGVYLWEVSRQHIATLEGHADAARSAAFSPDGGTLASVAEDGIRLWDLSARTHTFTLPGGAASAAFSPDGKTLAVGSGFGIELRDVATGQSTPTLPVPAGSITSVAFSPDGEMLASGADDHTVELWDVATRARIATLQGHTGTVRSMAFSPDGHTLVSGADDGVRVWDVKTQTNTETYEQTGGRLYGVRALAFSPGGTILASGFFGGKIKVWDIAAGESTRIFEDKRPNGWVIFSPDGTMLAFKTSRVEEVELWDVGTESKLVTLRGTGAHGPLVFSPDGRVLVSWLADGGIELWDLSEWRQPRPQTLVKVSGNEQQGVPGSALANPYVVEVTDQYGKPLQGAQVTFSVTAGEGILSGRFTLEKVTTDANGRAQAVLTLGPGPGTNTVEVTIPGLELVTFSAEGVGTPSIPVMEDEFQRWHLPDGSIARLGKGGIGRGDRVVAFSPDGRLLAVGCKTGTWLYDVTSSREVALLPIGGSVMSAAFSPDGSRLASAGSLWDVATGSHTPLETWYSVAFSPDGTLLALGAYDARIILWDLAAGTPAATYEHRGTVYSVAFSPDGTKLATGNIEGRVFLWDAATGTHETLEGHRDEVHSVAFSPDGTTLASGSNDHTVRLWDAGTGTHIAALEGHTSWVFSVAFSPDGETLASSSGDGTVRLWDLAARTGFATLEGHTGWVRSVAFSPDGTTLASVADGGTVRLWEVATGNTYTFAKGHKGWMNSVAFSPYGTTIASGYGNTTVELWDVETASSIAILRGHRLRINDVTFSPDGTLLASASSDRTIKLWDPATGANTATLESKAFRGWVRAVAFSPDGTKIASGQGNGIAKLWDTATGTNTAILRGHENPVSVLAFSPDGTVLATGEGPALVTGDSSNPRVKLWDVATGTNTATFELPTDSIVSLWFAPDGKPIASGRLGGLMGETVELWNLADNTLVATLSSRELWVFSMMVSTGTDVDRIDLAEVRRLAGGTRIPWHLIGATEFSPDGRIFAAVSANGTHLLWDLELLLPRPETLTKLSGDNQKGLPDSTLSEPFVVSVLDQYGDPFYGATVTFEVTAGGGSLSATTATTDENGLAAAALNLGRNPGRNTVTARVAELKPVIFGAAARSVPTSLTKVSGDKQEGPAGAALSEPLVVAVRDQVNDPFEGALVTFRVTAGEGTLSATTDTTDETGRASTTLTLGSLPGANTVSVRVARLRPVAFIATGQASPTSLTKLSGDKQQAAPGAQLAEPFVVSVLDQNGAAFSGAAVTFEVTAGEGTLSATTDTTDETGRASTTLTLGNLPGAGTVTVSVPDLEPVTFTVTAEATPDFDGDGETGFSDFFLLADAFGGSDPRFDLDGSGSVDFSDFFIFADHFADPARGKLLALARELIGLPDGPQLQQNAPNPFNSETVISWFQLKPGPARVQVFALTGQRVAVLHQGPKKAGVHRVHWEGRDDRGRTLASGVYLYRLVTGESVQTRKLTLLR